MTITLDPSEHPTANAPSTLSRALVLIYGIMVYGGFQLTFGYLIAFVLDLPVPRTLDRGAEGALARSLPAALGLNLGLLTLFGVQHSLMARPFFKRWLTRWVHPAAERSTYCLATCLALWALYLGWTPIAGQVWSIETPWLAGALTACAGLGFGVVLVSSFALNHFELFGLSQPWRYFRQAAEPQPKFRAPLMYRVVRHPIYAGMLMAIWFTPQMSRGHLLFSLICTAYILVGSTLEERDLVDALGSEYSMYQRTVGRLLPLPGRRWND